MVGSSPDCRWLRPGTVCFRPRTSSPTAPSSGPCTTGLVPLPLERSAVRLEPQQPWPEAPEYGSSGMVRSETARRAADQPDLGPDSSTGGPVSAGAGLELLADTAVAQPRAEPTQVALGTGTRTGQCAAGGGRGRAAGNRRTEAARNVDRTRRLERRARAKLNQARARADILEGGRND
ncbi:uncharacterized protein LOC104584719 [Brachypodium distachyon]|uniref:Uncharacterized protein n=1 Tax=Brachypodium distachyon TaxID=15368 RepID=A0A0Q3EXN5_BRADI|nr:uncharacterized protein LOC104584719 [Brachypodium distachyon]KQJ91220.1 hypothetical protein BRADI_4g36325v3 [Brachypodium distachyon]|eukprot:XP_010238432.1 uncharacterized protein LOC104584719 [Brachypodium distachyon]